MAISCSIDILFLSFVKTRKKNCHCSLNYILVVEVTQFTQLLLNFIHKSTQSSSFKSQHKIHQTKKNVWKNHDVFGF